MENTNNYTEKLKKIIVERGLSILKNEPTFSAIIKDIFPNDELLIRLLIQSIKDGIALKIEGLKDKKNPRIELIQISAIWEEKSGFKKENIDYIIELWKNVFSLSESNIRDNNSDEFSCISGKMSINAIQEELDKNMITVQPGTFVMGATAKQGLDAWDNEHPAHNVIINKKFKITKHPITQRLWTAVMGNNPSTFKDIDAPVDSVNWNDCFQFIETLNKRLNRTFNLPTEAQWEFAARGGNLSLDYKFSGNDNIEDIAWYSLNSKIGTKPVGLKKPNEIGLFDMNGNVWEWCLDWYNNYSFEIQEDPLFSQQTNLKVIRGGGWSSGVDFCRVSARQGLNPLSTYNYIGFRLVENIT